MNVKTDNTNLILTLTDPKGKRLQTIYGEAEMRHHFAAFYSGNYQICVQNQNTKQDARYSFSIKTGVQAMDYSNIVTKKHLRPVELQATMLSDLVQQLRTEFTALVLSEESLKSENEKIKSRVVIFGVISVVVMLVSTYLQITYLKNFFRYKKII